jgi:hypothetical protein
MDPWLEQPTLWLDVHNSLITAVRDDLVSKVAPRYYVGVEQHSYLVFFDRDLLLGRPDVVVGRTKSREPLPKPIKPRATPAAGVLELDVDVPVKDEIEEWYLDIRDAETGRVVTVIEVLSPRNKSNREGRKKYYKKRNQVFSTRTSLVEIDLLRAGKPMPIMIRQPVASDYRILVSRGRTRPRAKLYAFGVRQPIPPIPIPLLRGDPEPLLDLNTVLHALYERARFDLRLDYTKPPVPPLMEEDAAWAREIVLNMRR